MLLRLRDKSDPWRGGPHRRPLHAGVRDDCACPRPAPQPTPARVRHRNRGRELRRAVLRVGYRHPGIRSRGCSVLHDVPHERERSPRLPGGGSRISGGQCGLSGHRTPFKQWHAGRAVALQHRVAHQAAATHRRPREPDWRHDSRRGMAGAGTLRRRAAVGRCLGWQARRLPGVGYQPTAQVRRAV